jgi:cellulose synthase/poly-beta-1,6-N-acetylglucosamine synthase-like glycosyltransferase/peptidoglycan/xylan/chitin deacetylase (PgdA/CDA1 family)/spore germination protein YaaH
VVQDRPVFYDASGRRRRRFTVGIIAFVALVILAASLFATSILQVSPQAALPFASGRPALHGLTGQVGQLAHAARRRIRRALHSASWMIGGTRPALSTAPLAVGFYTPWDDASVASLARHVNELDWLVPGWLSISGPNHEFTHFPDPRGRRILAGASHRPRVLPMVQNALEGAWDGRGMASLLADKRTRAAVIARLEQFLLAKRADGVTFDFEELPDWAQPNYLAFLREARAAFAPHGWLIAVAVPVENRDWNLRAYAQVADKLFLMAYDEHYQEGDPGPIASQAWFAQAVAHAIAGIPRDKVIVALGSYAYDWTQGDAADAVSVEDAWLSAHESGTMPRFDPVSGNTSFSYTEDGKRHDVWIADAAALYNQILTLRTAGLDSLALWRLGSEDPSIWQIFGNDNRGPQSPQNISHVPAGTNVDIEGEGELLRVAASPVRGLRAIRTNHNQFIVDESFVQLPLPYVIERTGSRRGLVALTFDDGPDPTWTPRILDILKQYDVPATFFVIGENALTERSLLEREIAEGHEIGNHTYTHPNLGLVSRRETELELNATQRLVQAFTGRSMRLFRAPYFGDAEPTTADEIVPVEIGQRLGYLSVGLHVDPGDWRRPGVQQIVDRTIEQVTDTDTDRSGNVVLLHDSGGDRAQTVAALPAIITGLRARGYTLVPVSTLAGLSHTQIMPPLDRRDRLAAQTDLALFTVLGAIVISLRWLFALAITLGIGRAIVLSGLALAQARREGRIVRPPIDASRFVSVLIPAFNEARVIESSVRRVLASEQVRLEVIVIDDGSVDGTGNIVERAFADEPRVRLLRLENGGKARALNHGLALAGGEIIVALDADTQFEPMTIARLSRWFALPKIGAVAGNAKVGNRINLITRFQALEYITAQNLERRALGRLDSITVVPGAVGAWRAATLRQVGGYPADTLAEDQDLTISIQRAGWHVRYDQTAIAWTEAPETAKALAKQRFRWAFGTLQCLWKHRRILGEGRPIGLAAVGLPQAALFQIGFAAVSPVIDLALVISIVGTALAIHQHGWDQTQTDIAKMVTYWIAFTTIDMLSGVVAFALERGERWRLMWLLIVQRIGYRQLMYYVVLKAIAAALRGPRVGWGKLERSGRVAA